MGTNAQASALNATALGTNAKASGLGATAFGTNSQAVGSNAIAMGNGAQATGSQSISIGTGNVVSGNNSGAIGDPSTVTGNNSYALGNNNTIDADNAFVVGNNVSVASSLTGAVVLGDSSTVRASTATPNATIGGTTYTFAGGNPSAGSVVSVGAEGAERQIQNVAAGQISATSTDAVNGSQLFASNQAIDNLNINVDNLDKGAVKYDVNPDGTVNYNSVTLGGDTYNSTTKTGGTKITNVARGVDDSDAVNMSQLNETNTNVTNLGDTINNFAGDQSTEYTEINGRGIRYVRTNDTGLALSDSSAQGQGSTAVGYNATSIGDSSLALGRERGAADASKPTGLYIDSWMQFGWYDNTVRGDDLAKETYKSRTLSGSVEAGYAFELGQSGQNAWYIEPEAQVIVSQYKADKHVESNGTEVKVENGANVTTRLGARVFSRPLDASQKRLQPFVETNWWHNGNAQSMSFNGESQSANMASDVYELKVGAQAELAKGWTAWGQVGGQKARGDQTQSEVQMGIKYSW